MTTETKRKVIEEILRNIPDDVFQGILQDIEIDRQKETTITVTDGDIQKRIFNMLLDLGVPAHVKGYSYLKESIVYYLDHPGCAMTNELYPEIAKKFSTSKSRVERAIRHAVEICWNRGNTDVFESIFGYTVDPNRGKPTNSEFIAMLCEHLRMN